MLPAAAGAASAAPGRTCPVSYRYSPAVFRRSPDIDCDTLYVVGGLYGNVEALEAVLAMAGAEPGGATVVFNGDFHWFDVEAADFERIDAAVARHFALRGNVETEIAGEDSGAGCGCAYPADVSDADVSRSNLILERLRGTARRFPARRQRLAELPMHLLAAVGRARIGIVHGDATSLAGWGFARDRLDDPAHGRWVGAMFEQAQVEAFACSHTCMPALRGFAADGGARIVANNGAAGMPNGPGLRHGIATRISTRPSAQGARIEGLETAGVHVEALPIDYDHDRWLARFLAAWPAGSPAHDSYYRRMAR